MFSPATAQHEWLKNFVGEWRFEAECVMGPGQPPSKSTGTETVRMLGYLWLICEGRGAMPGGGEMSSIMTLGFDPARNRFVGTWVGSPMTHLFIYEGELEVLKGPDGKSTFVLPLNTTGPSFTDPARTARYQDVLELHPDGRRMLHSQVLGDDGKWTRFMSAVYTRA